MLRMVETYKLYGITLASTVPNISYTAQPRVGGSLGSNGFKQYWRKSKMDEIQH
jgi:hypothetical protein